MAGPVYRVEAHWDPEAEVWYAISDDVPGLATGADTFEALVEKLKTVVPEMLEENGVPPSDDGDVAFSVVAERVEHAERPRRVA